MKTQTNKFYTKTIVSGLRAEKSFFEKCDLVAKNENTNRNKLIVTVVSEYLDKNMSNLKKDNNFKDIDTNISCLICGKNLISRVYDCGHQEYVCNNCEKNK